MSENITTNTSLIESIIKEKPELEGKIWGDYDKEIDDLDNLYPLDYSDRIQKKEKTYVFITNSGQYYLAKCKVKDYYLVFRDCYRQKRKIIIAHDPTTLIIPKKLGRADKYLIWVVGQRAEVTHDAGATEYDLPTVEKIQKYTYAITEHEIPDVLAQKIRGKKGFWDNFSFIAIILVVFICLFFTFQVIESSNGLIKDLFKPGG